VNYQESELWKRYLSVRKDCDNYESARSRLRISFEKTRNSVVPLVAKIAHELPSLTVHNITHLDALWHIADNIISNEMEMNPAEVYVLGMAFLLHDAATSSFAFTGGVAGVRSTVQWKDYLAQNNLSESSIISGTVEYQKALFETLRVLHASQAKNLLTQKWKDIDNLERYLVEDVELRNHYGRIIGEISASHGDEPATVEARWAHVPPMSAHSSLGLDAKAGWVIDSLKISFLLRCIDAAHIDSLRAPDMEASFSVLGEDSKDHWIFQNKLGSIAINQKNELYWSGSAFERTHADAWWRCYDTCQMIDREISTANRILLDNGRTPLKAIGVMGAKDPAVFQKNVPVEGWQPVDFSFQVSQVGNVIEKFGGEKLYGTGGHWALRELIQNAADAIRARRIYTGKATHGQICIRLRLEEDSWWLDIQDDGIGMSRYVLTDVLLDFGRSLWKDSALRSQWSGLSSKGFTSVGQFGIGFFSVFMLGDEVKVTTWAHGRDIDQQLTLHLRNRVYDRPILVTPSADEKINDFGTRVSVKLNRGRAGVLRTFEGYTNHKKVQDQETLDELIRWLAPALDIDVLACDGENEENLIIKANDWKKLDPKALLRRILPRLPESTISDMSKYMQDIVEEDGTVVGRALVDSQRSLYYTDRHGTLVHRGVYSANCKGICGILLSNNNGDLARQSATPVASAQALTAWAHTQMNNSINDAPTLSERGISLGVVESSMVVGKLNGSYVTVFQIVNQLLLNKLPVVLLTSWPDCPDEISQSDFEDFELLDGIVDLTHCMSDTRFDFNLRKWIEEILPESEDHPRTVLNLLLYFAGKYAPGLIIEDANAEVGMVGDLVFSTSCTILRLSEEDD